MTLSQSPPSLPFFVHWLADLSPGQALQSLRTVSKALEASKKESSLEAMIPRLKGKSMNWHGNSHTELSSKPPTGEGPLLTPCVTYTYQPVPEMTSEQEEGLRSLLLTALDQAYNTLGGFYG